MRGQLIHFPIDSLAVLLFRIVIRKRAVVLRLMARAIDLCMCILSAAVSKTSCENGIRPATMGSVKRSAVSPATIVSLVGLKRLDKVSEVAVSGNQGKKKYRYTKLIDRRSWDSQYVKRWLFGAE